MPIFKNTDAKRADAQEQGMNHTSFTHSAKVLVDCVILTPFVRRILQLWQQHLGCPEAILPDHLHSARCDQFKDMYLIGHCFVLALLTTQWNVHVMCATFLGGSTVKGGQIKA
jgi:hypothetical protein